MNPEHRKKLLDMAKRRARPGSGSNLRVLRENRSTYLPEDLVPYLVLMKLASGRVQDLADISRMLGGASGEGIKETTGLIARIRSQDIEDLESLIALGKLEYGG